MDKALRQWFVDLLPRLGEPCDRCGAGPLELCTRPAPTWRRPNRRVYTRTHLSHPSIRDRLGAPNE